MPFSKRGAEKELEFYQVWYNGVRPHERLRGATPDEVYRGVEPFWKRARFEPRARWRREAPCASPQSRVAGRCGAELELIVNYLGGRKHLPVVGLKRVA